MAVAEALAYGLPVISTRTGAIPELVGRRCWESWWPLATGMRLREALAQALTEPELLPALGRGALTARARLAPWPQASARMARLLAAVLRARSAAPSRECSYRMR